MPHPGQKSTGHFATPGAEEEALAIVQFAPPPTKRKQKDKFNRERVEWLNILLKLCAPKNRKHYREATSTSLEFVYNHGSH